VGIDSKSSSAPDRALREATGRADQNAFRGLIEPHRAELYAHCYRMLGSPADAEDALQEAMVRAWRGLPRFEAGRPIRPWLYRIATNACLDLLAKRPKRMVPIDDGHPAVAEAGPGEPLVERLWVEPYPDQVVGVADGYAAPDARYELRESVELAFIAALQHLPARQRAVLILRDVLGFSAREVADSLQTSTASVNSALQRARATVDKRLPPRSQQATLRALGDDRLRDLVQGYVEAWDSRDIDAMVAMLVEEATFAMPPYPNWFQGREAVIAFIVSTGRPQLRHVLTQANGQPAVGWYRWNPDTGSHTPTSIEVLTFEGARVKDITAFVSPLLFPRFGLPAQLPAT
jgi:RNA polymerase sigma-70 factor (ECF subfamily)